MGNHATISLTFAKVNQKSINKTIIHYKPTTYQEPYSLQNRKQKQLSQIKINKNGLFLKKIVYYASSKSYIMKNIVPSPSFFSLFLLLSILLSCNEPTEPASNNKGSVVFTFDDTNIDSWYNNRDLFKQYNIKATFFLTQPYNMDASMLKKLHRLEDRGHEVGCHSMNHINPWAYLEMYSVDEYITNEVLSARDTMIALGFNPTSYAIPFGLTTNELNESILKYFSNIRLATQNYNNTTLDQIDEIFYPWNEKRIHNAMGLDVYYQISIENLTLGLQKAKENQEAIIFYCHKIDDSGNSFTTSRAYLEEAFQAVNQVGLKSIRFKDLN